jgi:hypothetical protein
LFGRLQRLADRSDDEVSRARLAQTLMRKIEETDPNAHSIWGEPLLPKLVKQLEELTRTPEDQRQKYIRYGMITTGVGIGVCLVLYLFAGALTASGLLPDEVVPLIQVAWAKGLIPFFIGLMMWAYGQFFARLPRSLVSPREAVESSSNSVLDEVSSTVESLYQDPIGSVTEHTTRHLETENDEPGRVPGGRSTARN